VHFLLRSTEELREGKANLQIPIEWYISGNSLEIEWDVGNSFAIPFITKVDTRMKKSPKYNSKFNLSLGV
jgi:hypothetical protein